VNGYIAFWKEKRIEVRANTAYAAQEEAAEQFGKRCKRWDVAVVIAEVDGKPVTHSTNEL